MKISTRSRYGLRLMYDLAIYYNKGTQFLKDIARRQNISEKYLSQIIIPLKAAGLVNANRGAHGGYTLAKAPSEITAKDIVIAIEGNINIVECVNNPEVCNLLPVCDCRCLWMKLNESILSTLESFTLEDFVKKYNERNTDSFGFSI